VKKLATRQQKIQFTIKRFKGFWNEFKRSKRGIVGLIVIIFFTLIAIFAPWIAPTKPIDPQYGIGEYPKIGPVKGVKIAETLCKPTWYKYLPWVYRGRIELTEKFYTLVKYYPELDRVDTTYGHIGETATDSNLILTHRVASIENIKVIYPNGTSRNLSNAEWETPISEGILQTRQIKFLTTFPNATQFEVEYFSGTDLVENMDLVSDNQFEVAESFEEWIVEKNSSDIAVTYNDKQGFTYTAEDTKKGCIEISYTPSIQNASGFIEVTLSTPFNYPYYQPPRSFFIHFSVKSEFETPISVNILFYKENGTQKQEFVVARRQIVYSPTEYIHSTVSSYDPATAKNVKINPPADGIFASPGNYTFSVQIIVPANSTAKKVYIDNVECLIYGNVYGLFGTDNGIPYPRDIFSILVHGSRVSLIVGVLSALFGTIIGLFLGLVSGYLGGIVDEAIMRFADLLLVLPTLPLFIVLVVALRTATGYISMWNIIIILTLFGWMGFARSVRSMVLSIRERAFVEAAKAAGASKMHIINRHILPNVFALVYITLATSVPGAIITEASLSWLGLGDPLLPSWGKVLYDFNVSGVAVAKGLTEYWFWIFPACVAIAILATAFILVGYALDEILNPRLRERR